MNKNIVKPSGGISFDVVMHRVASLLGISSDSDVARALKVTPQTFSTWKRRGTVPYEKLAFFAADNDVSLDYLIPGKGRGDWAGGQVDPVLLEGIEKAFEEYDESVLKQLHTGTAHDIGLVYNRVIRMIKRDQNWGSIVQDEVAYLVKVRSVSSSQLSLGQPVTVHEEEQRLFHKIGTTPREVNGGLDVANPLDQQSFTVPDGYNVHRTEDNDK